MTGMTGMGGQMVGAGRCHGRFVSRRNCAVRVGHQLGHVDGMMSGMPGMAYGRIDSMPSMTAVGGEMFGPGRCHGRLVYGGDGAVGMRLQSVQSVGGSHGHAGANTSSKNQK